MTAESNLFIHFGLDVPKVERKFSVSQREEIKQLEGSSSLLPEEIFNFQLRALQHMLPQAIDVAPLPLKIKLSPNSFILSENYIKHNALLCPHFLDVFKLKLLSSPALIVPIHLALNPQ